MAVPRRIVAFHLDEEHHWVARLECGHNQHVRHTPPWMNRPWVVTPDGRASAIGQTLSHAESVSPGRHPILDLMRLAIRGALVVTIEMNRRFSVPGGRDIPREGNADGRHTGG